jgi:predicted metal-dependent enzyme (double-stranded beta helix superfamily)
VFNVEAFVTRCVAATTTADPVRAVQEVVEAALADRASIDKALGTEVKRENDTLFSSANLTVQRILWPGGVFSSTHDHRMWAVIGVYRGEELNHFYERTPNGIAQCGGHAVSAGEMLVLGAEAIHSVENPHRELTAGLHVYGGDIIGIERSAWGPDGREVSFRENSAAYRSMFEPMRDLAREHAMHVTDEARYDALTALTAACRREHRYPTPDEARQVIADAWRIVP